MKKVTILIFLLISSLAIANSIETPKPLIEYLGESHKSSDFKKLIKSLKKQGFRLEEKELNSTIEFYSGDYLTFTFEKNDKKTELVRIQWEGVGIKNLTNDIAIPEFENGYEADAFYLSQNFGFNPAANEGQPGEVMHEGLNMIRFSETKNNYIFCDVLAPGVLFYTRHSSDSFTIKKIHDQNQPLNEFEKALQKTKTKSDFFSYFNIKPNAAVLPEIKIADDGFKYVGASENEKEKGRHILEAQGDNGVTYTYNGTLEGNDASGTGYLEIANSNNDIVVRVYSRNFDKGFINGSARYTYYHKDDFIKYSNGFKKDLGRASGHFIYSVPVGWFTFKDKVLGIEGSFVPTQEDFGISEYGPVVYFNIENEELDYQYYGTGYAFPYMLHGKGKLKPIPNYGFTLNCNWNQGVIECDDKNKDTVQRALKFPAKQ